MTLKPRRVWAGRQTKELNAMAKDTKAAGGCLWEAGEANFHLVRREGLKPERRKEC